MRDTVLANTGCLAVFQVAGTDARQLVYELGRDRVSEEDIVSLGVHECYIRATVGSRREPAFSMTVLAPEPGDPDVAARIRAEASAYTTPIEVIAAAEEERRPGNSNAAANDVKQSGQAAAAEAGEGEEDADDVASSGPDRSHQSTKQDMFRSENEADA